MPITKLQFKPGINREATQYAEGGGWYNGNMVRFRHGFPEKVGGWIRYTAVAFKGVCRVLKNWTLLNSSDCLFLGTSKKTYVEYSGNLYDITPLRFTDTKTNPITTGIAGTNTHTYTTSAPHNAVVGDYVDLSNILTDVDGICTDSYNNPFSTTAIGSPVVLVTTPHAHYAVVGDVVTFSGATGFAGIPAGNLNTSLTVLGVNSPTQYVISVATNATSVFIGGGGATSATYLARLNNEFTVLSIPTATSFTFQTVTPCVAGNVTGGGANVVATFQISLGFTVNVTGGGWGTGNWSRGAWSSPLTASVSGISLRLWTVDNFGQDLVFAPRDGPLYYWAASGGFSNNRGTLVANMVGASDVPTQVSIVRVTNTRIVLAIGTNDRITMAFDPLLVRWSDQENVTQWTPSITNTAGSLRIPMGSYVVAAMVARLETLIWTDHSLHSMQFIGPPYVFGMQTLAENTNIIGPNAAASVNNIVYWMGKNRFWVYSGRVQTVPCTVQRYVFDNIDPTQGAQVYATVNPQFTEITWFYCSINAPYSNCDSYVSYNYQDDLWTYGTMGRSAMTMCPGRSNYPYATDGGYTQDDGVMYLHEYGYDDGSTVPPSPITSYLESSDISVQDGNKIMFVDRVIPDLTFDRSTAVSPQVDVVIEGKKFPGRAVTQADDRSIAKSFTVDQYTDQVWVRVRGREIRVYISSNGLGVCWMLGAIRINIRQDGSQ